MRPNVVSGCNKKVSGSRECRAANGCLNTACFQPVNTGTTVAFGNEPRVDPNMRQDTMNNWDFSISKRNNITEQVYLQFTAEFFNTFNHPRFGLPGVSVDNAFGPFAKVTSTANQPRAIQFGLRLGF